jgi:hypothetical protein
MEIHEWLVRPSDVKGGKGDFAQGNHPGNTNIYLELFSDSYLDL